MFLARRVGTYPQRSGVLLLAAGYFAAGLTAGALVLSPDVDRFDPPRPSLTAPAPALRGGQPVEVLRVIDGDTFQARIRIWPGMDVTTLVRLRGIDAPELRARCEDERAMALTARDALARLLNEGTVGVTRVTQDKYGGRVNADVSTAQTGDVAQALLAGGHARRYQGGKRQSWCG